jgi:methyl-accepting chemotaxis protein
MRDKDDLDQVVETNFRLGILATRQMGARLDRRVDGLGRRMNGISQTTGEIAHGLGELAQRTNELADRTSELADRTSELAERTSKLAKEMGGVSNGLESLATDTKAFGTEIRTDFDDLADRQEEMIIVFRQLGTSSVNVNKELEEIKRRLTDLENRAS